MNWVTLIAGVVLILAPFVTGYSGTPMTLWTSLFMGAVIALLGCMKLYKWAAVAGVVTIVAPWILGFSGIGTALGMCLAVGIVVTAVAGYKGVFAKKNDQFTTAQQRSA